MHANGSGRIAGQPLDQLVVQPARRHAVRDHFLFIPELYSRLDASVTQVPAYEDLLMRASLGAPGATAPERQIEFLRNGRVARQDLSLFVKSMLPSLSQLQLVELSSVIEFASAGRSMLEQAALLRLLQAAARARGVRLPEPTRQWCERLAMDLFLLDGEPEAAEAVNLAEDFKLVRAYPDLARLASRDSPRIGLRSRAISACVTVDLERSLPLARATIEDESEPLLLRQAAVVALAGANRDLAREELARFLNAAPFSLSVEAAAGLALDRQGAQLLLAAIHESRAPARLLEAAVVRERLNVVAAAELERMGESRSYPDLADEEVQQVIARRRRAFLQAAPNPILGSRVFRDSCAPCHAIDAQGGTVGPALDAIGTRGVERLLEDILAPSRNIAPEFRAGLVTLTDGRTLFGRVVRRDARAIVLVDSQGKESRFAADDVEQMRPSAISIMPGNAGESIKESDFNDLISFLLNQRGE